MRRARGRCRPDGERAGVVVGDPLGPDRVGQPALLAHLLEEPAGESAAQGVVEHGEARQRRSSMRGTGRGTRPRGAPARSGGRSTAGARPGAAGPSRSGRAPRSRRSKRAVDARRHRSWSTVARRRDHDVARPVVVRRRTPGCRRPVEATTLGGGAQHLAPERVAREHAAAQRSATRSAGSSACIRISSRITWRSASTSSGRSAGSHMIVARGRRGRASRSSASSRT